MVTRVEIDRLIIVSHWIGRSHIPKYQMHFLALFCLDISCQISEMSCPHFYLRQTMQGVGELLQFGGFGGHRIFAKDTCERISIDGTQVLAKELKS